MDDDVIVIYDEIEEEPEQFTAQNYEYMLAQSLLTKEAIQEKLADPSENANFQFISSSSHNSSIWDNFQAISYGGVEQNFFKCRNCNDIFDKDPQKSLGQLRNHKCKKIVPKREREILDYQEILPKTTTTTTTPKNNSNRKIANKNNDKSKPLTREQLEELYSNPKERPNFITKQKNNFRCFAWQWMDLVFYKKQRQPFARCRFCEMLVTYSNKNGTSSIRKHALRCSAILAAKHNLGKQGIQAPNLQIKGSNNAKFEDEDSFSEDSNSQLECSLIPDVEMYEEEEMPLNSLMTTMTTNKQSQPQPKTQASKRQGALSLAQLRSLYNSDKNSKAFHFSKHKVGGVKNTIYNWLEMVFYKDMRQNCYRCTVCDNFLNSANENELAYHVQSHNIKNNHNSKKMPVIKKEKLIETITEPKSKASLKRHSMPCPKTEPIEEIIEDQPETYVETEHDATNTATQNLIDCVISSGGQSLSFMDDPNFRLFAQSLINLGAKYGERNSNDFLPSIETILKYSIPHRMRTLKTEIKEIIANESHLSISVDLVKDSAPHSKPVSYFTVKTHIISESFTSKTYVVGIQDFQSDKATDEVIREAFLEIMKEYLNTDELKKRCIIVLNEHNEALTKAFADYTCLPSITHSLESIINKVLVVQDPELKISDLVVKVQELFEHIIKEHNYFLSKGECLLDLLEEFYEMNKPIEKLLKSTRPCQRDHSVLSDIPKNKVKTILNGFEVIKLCIDTIRQNQITINGILLWKKKMVEQYSPVLFEHQMNARLKFHTLELIQTQLCVDDPIYKIALFLNPNFKNLKFLSESERKEVFSSIKEMYFSKIRHIEKEKASEDDADIIDKEIHNYYVTKSFDSSSEDLLKFWKRTTNFPNLRTLARYVLSLPSTSDGVHEDIFHKAQRSLANGIGTSADFNSIIFLNSNFVEVS
ncbi:uncharacterized protein LOC129918695 [Episyrphus balteatus]|uniref:uncharacterized protein LOC129918695 n=1 Tax=Episyrphus balteatus TaxID=286459 RepID=UPI00248574C3|nr:uncharacterized protein LOC129918695 [Episyrphus balteatus]